jgi:hypothetical protein
MVFADYLGYCSIKAANLKLIFDESDSLQYYSEATVAFSL